MIVPVQEAYPLEAIIGEQAPLHLSLIYHIQLSTTTAHSIAFPVNHRWLPLCCLTFLMGVVLDSLAFYRDVGLVHIDRLISSWLLALLVHIASLVMTHRYHHLLVLVDISLIVVIDHFFEQELRRDLNPLLPTRETISVYIAALLLNPS